jgi:hypothetical protein
MARGRYTPDGSKKLCKGRTHPDGGEYVHLKNFHVHKSGRLKGRPFYVCIPCWNVLRGRDQSAGMISWEEAWPVVNRLIELLGSKRAVAQALGRHRNWLYELKWDKLHREHLNEAKALLRQLEATESFHAQGEAEVVRAEPLSTVLRGWVTEWIAERPTNHQSMGTQPEDGRDFMGPIEFLAEKTEINPRRVSGIVNGEFEHVSLSQADALLTAAGLWDYLSLGEIPIIPNPNWSMEKWQAYMAERGC